MPGFKSLGYVYVDDVQLFGHKLKVLANGDSPEPHLYTIDLRLKKLVGEEHVTTNTESVNIPR
ncbi:hypothetical protein BpJC7_08030 [Weizmannia acidilactici]|uniref:Uncharacterized protein n=1 Tax=Weizmannia acidilactici TaxID=2607726 RepID=A0A5J4JG93_9BACI|nr:hypothetical protein BpJC4_08250 [Weizmannia acidilactici]GER69500.1 hypothetical protein BpJC7_08030 [Weizmannia acidilactici]GER73037.1 hypothetical protein BpPP18_11040 [Weizmannia acidilactici]